MSFFDSFRRTTFDVVGEVFADGATWAPSAGGELQGAKVFFNDPTDLVGYARKGQHVKGFAEFDTDKPFMEYIDGVFPGLRESVDRKTKEVVSINGIQYRVLTVKAISDGKTLYATLNKI